MPNEVATRSGWFFSRASSFISSGCQSAAYFISKRVMVKSVGAPVWPVEVMTQPDGVRPSVTCSRPTCVPRTKIPKTASPGVGDVWATWAAAGVGRGQHGGRRQGGTMKAH